MARHITWANRLPSPLDTLLPLHDRSSLLRYEYHVLESVKVEYSEQLPCVVAKGDVLVRCVTHENSQVELKNLKFLQDIEHRIGSKFKFEVHTAERRQSNIVWQSTTLRASVLRSRSLEIRQWHKVLRALHSQPAHSVTCPLCLHPGHMRSTCCYKPGVLRVNIYWRLDVDDDTALRMLQAPLVPVAPELPPSLATYLIDPNNNTTDTLNTNNTNTSANATQNLAKHKMPPN